MYITAIDNSGWRFALDLQYWLVNGPEHCDGVGLAGSNGHDSLIA